LKVLAGAACLAVVVSGCGGSTTPGASAPVEGSWEDVVAAADQEGSVLLYSSQNPTNLQALKTAFEQAYPDITMTFVRGTDGEMNPKVELENQTGQGAADVHMVTDASWITSAAESGQYSTPLVGPTFESAPYTEDGVVLDDEFFRTSAAVFAMGWNTDAVPEGFATPQDMLDPQYSGRIGIVNPQGIAAYVDFYQFYEKNFGSDFLEQLGALRPRVYPSALAIAQALTSGEIVAAPGVQPLVNEVASGAPVDWALPDPAWGTPSYTHVLSAAPHPNAGQVLADFMASEAGQTALNTGYGSMLPTDGSVADATQVPLPDPDELTSEKTQAYQQKWESIFQQ
jgi:iron(III) transport system substrate-binding protein